MKTIHQCVVLEPGQSAVSVLTPAHLRRFFPEVADPDFGRAVIEDIWATQVSSDRDDAVALRLPKPLEKLSRLFDWDAEPCLAVAMPLLSSGPQGSARAAADAVVNLADLLETPLYKSVVPGAHGLRTIDIDSTLSARLSTLQEIDETQYTDLVREHFVHDTVVDLSAGLQIALKSRTEVEATEEVATSVPGTITLMLAFRMALVSRPVR